MESRAFALWTGLFVIGLTIAVATWASWLAREPTERVPYRVVATVPVTGLNPQAQVRYRGISVGRVAAIHLDPRDPRRIFIDVEVDAAIPVTRGTYAQLGMEGITGIAYVHLLDDGKDARRLRSAGNSLAEIVLRPSFFDTVADGAEGAVRDARELMAGVSALVTPENRKAISATLASLERVTANLEKASARLPALVQQAETWMADDKRALVEESLRQAREAASALPRITGETERLLRDTRGMVGQFDRLSAEAQGVVNAVQAETLPRVNDAADSAGQASRRLGSLAQEIEKRPDSVIWGRPKTRPGPGEPGFQ